MKTREWLGPFAVAVVAAVGVSLLPDLSFPDQSGLAQSDTLDPYVLLPWAEVQDHDAILLRYNITPAHNLGGMLDLHTGSTSDKAWTFSGIDLACERGGRCLRPATEGIPLRPAASYEALGYHPIPSNETFGEDGLRVEATFYMFTSSGHLLATNAPRSQWLDYDLHGDFTTVSGTTFWFGNGTLRGARDVPLYKDGARDLLWGTPVGGVQSAVLETHEYDWLVGPVWITARIEAVSPPY